MDNNYEHIYDKILSNYSHYKNLWITNLKNGIFEINLKSKIKIKKIKIYNLEKRAFLMLRGIELYYNNKLIILEDKDYDYILASKRMSIDYKLKFNEIVEPNMIVTGRKPSLLITFKKEIYIDKIVIYTRTKGKFYRNANYLTVDISSDGILFESIYSNPNNLKQYINKISDELCKNENVLNYKQLFNIVRIFFGIWCEYDLAFETWMLECYKCNINPEPIKNFINEKLKQQKIQITNTYGLVKSFSVWTYEEKNNYLISALNIFKYLYLFTPHVFFSYGTLIGFIREKDFFIPHDIDIDISCVLNCNNYSTPSKFKEDIIPILLNNEFKVKNLNSNFLTVSYKNSPYFDIFPGIEDKSGNVDFIGKHYLPSSILYPTITIDIYNYRCPIPRSPFEYLKTIYTENWRIPIDAKNRININMQ